MMCSKATFCASTPWLTGRHRWALAFRAARPSWNRSRRSRRRLCCSSCCCSSRLSRLEGDRVPVARSTLFGRHSQPVYKGIVQRPRPEGISLVTEHGFSFPSGHSMAAMAFFGLLVWLIWHYEKDKPMRIACCVALSVVIVMVGVSRIYLGVHYASDVIGGFCVSLAWLTLYTRIVAPLFLDPALARDGR